MNTRTQVMTIANRLSPVLKDRGEAMRRAWAFVKAGSIVTKAVGVTFGNRQEVLRKLEQNVLEDTSYRLVREPSNPYDRNAIAVDGLLWGRRVGQVGHLPREVAAILAPLMDAGMAAEAVQYAIYGGIGEGSSLGVKLQVRACQEGGGLRAAS